MPYTSVTPTEKEPHMFVKPSNTNPSALRKAAWEKAQAERNAKAQAALVASVKKG